MTRWALFPRPYRLEWQRRCRDEVLGALAGADWRTAASSPNALRRTPLLRACVDETMRLHPPVTRLPARVVGQCRLAPG